MKSRPTVLLAAFLVVYLFVEGLSFAGLLLIRKIRHIEYDPNLSSLSKEQKATLTTFLNLGHGTRITMDGNLGWVTGPADANSAGMRDNREYDTMPRPGIVRISAFGDSFTYGADVTLGDNWAKQIPAMSSSVEVLNYGVGAYGLDQAYLRYLQVGADNHPSAVFIGYMSENLCRNVSVFRPFYTNMYRDFIFTKPRFQVKHKQLVLLRNPLSTLEEYEDFLRNDTKVLPELGKNDYWYQLNYNRGSLDFSPSVRFGKLFLEELNEHLLHPIFKLDGMYDTRSEAYEVTVRIFDAFYRTALENGALPVILVFPDLNDQYRSRNGKVRRYTPLLEYFRSKGYRFVDLQDAFEPYQSRYNVDQLASLQWGHYTPLGNEIVAKYIVGQMTDWGFVDPLKLNQEILAERRRFTTKVQ